MKRSSLLSRLPVVRLPLFLSFLAVVLLSVAVTLLALWCQPNTLSETLEHFSAQPLLILLNLVPIFLVTAFLACLFRNAFWGAAAGNLLVCLLSIANRIKIEIRDDPVFPRDLTLLKEVGSAIEHYDIHFPWGVIAVVVLCSLVLALLGVVLRPSPVPRLRGWLGRLLGAAGCLVVFVSLMLTVYASGELYGSFQVSDAYHMTLAFNELGFPYCFCRQFTTYPIDKPENFSRTDAQSWDSAETQSGAGKPVHVVMVMNEAFSDITDYDVFHWSEDPLKNLHAIQADPHTIFGHVVVPGFAAGTANTEFDVLTGIQTNVLSPAIATSAFRVVTRNLDSLFRVYGDEGYHTSFFHPGDDWFYNRENVYRYFGAQKTLFEDEMKSGLQYKGGWVTDACLADFIETEFEQTVQDGQLLFHFTTTIQNHMSYTLDKYGDGYEFPPVETTVPLSEEAETLLKVYVEGLRDGDALLGQLHDYFAAQTEPVVLVYFGDHIPYLGGNQLGYAELGVTNDPLWADLISFETPYMIWANDAAADVLDWDNTVSRMDLPEDGRLSAAYLGAAVLELTGRGTETAWFAYLNELRRELPVVQRQTYVLSDGTVTQTLDETLGQAVAKWQRWSYYKLKYKEIP